MTTFIYICAWCLVSSYYCVFSSLNLLKLSRIIFVYIEVGVFKWNWMKSLIIIDQRPGRGGSVLLGMVPGCVVHLSVAKLLHKLHHTSSKVSVHIQLILKKRSYHPKWWHTTFLCSISTCCISRQLFAFKRRLLNVLLQLVFTTLPVFLMFKKKCGSASSVNTSKYFIHPIR